MTFRASKLAVILLSFLPTAVVGFNVLFPNEKKESSISSSKGRRKKGTSLNSDQMANSWITAGDSDVFSSLWEVFQPSKEEPDQCKPTFWDTLWKKPSDDMKSTQQNEQEEDRVADAFGVLESMFEYVTEAVQKPVMASLVPNQLRKPQPLARQGDWEAYLDRERTGLVYYYNKRTHASRWNPPSSDFPAIDTKAIRDASLLCTSGVWAAYLDEQGLVYYYNRITKVSTWEKPFLFPTVSAAAQRLPPRALAKQGHWSAYPSGHFSLRSVYYFNEVTGVSQWDPPTSNFPSVAAPTPQEEEEQRHLEEEELQHETSTASWLDGVVNALGYASKSSSDVKKNDNNMDPDSTKNSSSMHQVKEFTLFPFWMTSSSTQQSASKPDDLKEEDSNSVDLESAKKSASMYQKKEFTLPFWMTSMAQKSTSKKPQATAQPKELQENDVNSMDPDSAKKSASVYQTKQVAQPFWAKMTTPSSETSAAEHPQQAQAQPQEQAMVDLGALVQPVGSVLQKASLHMVAVGLDALSGALKATSTSNGVATKTTPRVEKAAAKIEAKTKTRKSDDSAISSFSDLDQKSDAFFSSIAESSSPRAQEDQPVDLMGLVSPIGSVVGKLLHKSTTDMVAAGLDALSNSWNATSRSVQLQSSATSPSTVTTKSDPYLRVTRDLPSNHPVAAELAEAKARRMQRSPLKVIADGASQKPKQLDRRQPGKSLQKDELPRATWNSYSQLKQEVDNNRKSVTELKAFSDNAAIHSFSDLDEKSDSFFESISVAKRKEEKPVSFFGSFSSPVSMPANDVVATPIPANTASDKSISNVDSKPFNIDEIVKSFAELQKKAEDFSKSITKPKTAQNNEQQVDFMALARPVASVLQKTTVLLVLAGLNALSDALNRPQPKPSTPFATETVVEQQQQQHQSRAQSTTRPVAAADIQPQEEHEQQLLKRAMNVDPLAHVEPDIPHLASWKQNEDGSITGIVRHQGKELFPLHSLLTTSPVGAGARKHTIVETEFGGRYLLL